MVKFGQVFKKYMNPPRKRYYKRTQKEDCMIWGRTPGTEEPRTTDSRYTPKLAKRFLTARRHEHGWKLWINSNETRGARNFDYWRNASHVLPANPEKFEFIGQVVSAPNTSGICQVSVADAKFYPRWGLTFTEPQPFKCFDETLSVVDGDIVYLQLSRNIAKNVHYTIGHVIQPNIEARLRMNLGLDPTPEPEQPWNNLFDKPQAVDEADYLRLFDPVHKMITKYNATTPKLRELGILNGEGWFIERTRYNDFLWEAQKLRREARFSLAEVASRMRAESSIKPSPPSRDLAEVPPLPPPALAPKLTEVGKKDLTPEERKILKEELKEGKKRKELAMDTQKKKLEKKEKKLKEKLGGKVGGPATPTSSAATPTK